MTLSFSAQADERSRVGHRHLSVRHRYFAEQAVLGPQGFDVRGAQ
jgi:hypothetical protein